MFYVPVYSSRLIYDYETVQSLTFPTSHYCNRLKKAVRAHNLPVHSRNRPILTSLLQLASRKRSCLALVSLFTELLWISLVPQLFHVLNSTILVFSTHIINLMFSAPCSSNLHFYSRRFQAIQVQSCILPFGTVRNR